MDDDVKNALRVAQRKIKPVRMHHSIARTGYAKGGQVSHQWDHDELAEFGFTPEETQLLNDLTSYATERSSGGKINGVIDSDPDWKMSGRHKFEDGGEVAPYGVVDMGDKIILGSPHGEKIDLPEDLRARVQDLTKQYGAYYEGNAGDVEANKDLIPEYRGSWDTAHGSKIKGYPVEYLAPMFSNVDVNHPAEMFADPERSIMASIIANQDKAKYFEDRKFDEKALRDFLQQGSEDDADLLKMAQDKATPENLKRFFSKGESLMWPENWQEYPHKLGKIAKRFEDARNQYLLDAPPGVYVAGAGHIPELRRLRKDLKVIGGERSGYSDGGLTDALNHAEHGDYPLHQGLARHGYATDGAVEGDVQTNEQQLPMMAQQAPEQNIQEAMAGKRANEEQSLREAAQQPLHPGVKSAVDFATYSMVSPDTAPQRMAQTMVNSPETIKNFAQNQYEGAKQAGQYFTDTMSGRRPMDITSPEAIQAGNTIAGMVGTGGMSLGEAPSGSLGMFVGRNAKFRPAEQAMFDQGEQRLAAGHDPRQVHAETNVHPIHGGEPAFEISDKPAKFMPENFTVESRPFYDTGEEVYKDVPSYANLEHVLPHPELYEKYSHLKEMPVFINHEDPMYAGYVSERYGNPGYISLGSSLLSDHAKARDVLLHEIQHAVQAHEDWPMGGDPDSPMLHQVPRGATGRERMESRLNDDFYPPKEAYGLTAGERQAYNVEARSELGPEAFASEENRKQIYPLDTEPNVHMGGRTPNENEILIRRMGEHKYTPLDVYMRNKPRYADGGAIEDALRLAKGGRTPAWQRAEGKAESGGLNAKGRASAKAQGHNLKPPAPHPKNEKDAARKKSFCSRMSGMKRENTSSETANDPNSRINKSLRAWNC